MLAKAKRAASMPPFGRPRQCSSASKVAAGATQGPALGMRYLTLSLRRCILQGAVASFSSAKADTFALLISSSVRSLLWRLRSAWHVLAEREGASASRFTSSELQLLALRLRGLTRLVCLAAGRVASALAAQCSVPAPLCSLE